MIGGSRTFIIDLLRKELLKTSQHLYGKVDYNLRKKLYSRQEFLKKTSSAALLTVLGNTYISSCNISDSHNNTDVIILGAGLAGLTAGNHFKKANIDFKLFEATQRAGGRVFSILNAFDKGLVAEMGGEFIDSNHQDMLDLTKEFNVELFDINQKFKDKGLIKETYYFNNRHFTELELANEIRLFIPSIIDDINKLDSGDVDVLKNQDKISIDGYLTSKGISGWLFDLLTNAFTAEFGTDSNEQSSLNLLTMIDVSDTKNIKLYGESDERYKIIGGNEVLIKKMALNIHDSILYDHLCVEIKESGNGYQVIFKEKEIWNCKYLVIAIPFTALRKIDLPKSISDQKLKVIHNLKYGTNSKLVLSFNNNPWSDLGFSGYLFSDKIQNGWDCGIGPVDHPNSAYTIFLGGKSGQELSDSNSLGYWEELNEIFQIKTNDSVPKKLVFNWYNSSLVQGSYAVYKVGDYSALSGQEALPCGNIYFAGEHCSEDFKGYMNGAAETGRIAAGEILKKIAIG
jgi:monoamine oxidase